MSTRFEYGYASIRDLAVHSAVAGNGKPFVKEVVIDGRPARPTPRFWTSLSIRFGFSGNVFKLFSHAEVFQRISEVAGNDRLRWCIERGADGTGTALAVTNPGAALIRHDDLVGLLGQYEAENVAYHGGFVRSTHSPRLGGTFHIAGDDFRNRFVIDTPIDGFGRPLVYLSLLRLICTNGAVGYSKAFRSELNVGRGDDGTHFALVRVLDGFNNEEGFAALRQRFESAATSWASVNEANKLYKTLLRLHHQHDLPGNAPLPVQGGDGAAETSRGQPILRAFYELTGDLNRIYGMANLDALSVKRQRTLPANCKVYDLLNFASEVATHHATPAGNRALQAFLGDLVSNEYDLEGTGEQLGDWKDFFVANRDTTTTLAEMHTRSGRV
jgi:hypothetical protein